ncbi:flagellar basal body L-ring protein FlgH [bacterium]|nr:flagellar basal body L-ring protein FlgH [bacterium]
MKKLILALSLIIVTTNMCLAESLFSLNTQYANYIEPRPLYGTVRARNVGDVVTIILEEAPTIQDSGQYETAKESNIVDNISTAINTVFKTDLSNGLNGAGGSLTVDGGTTVKRQLSFKDNVAAQVVQVLPNGNLLVQGKKVLLNQNERVDLVVSGIVDPRWINQAGEIESGRVSNLQFALNGAGTVSRGQNEGILNKFIRMVF